MCGRVNYFHVPCNSSSIVFLSNARPVIIRLRVGSRLRITGGMCVCVWEQWEWLRVFGDGVEMFTILQLIIG